MIFGGQNLSDADIAQCWQAVASSFHGQVVICDILLKCGFFDEISPDSMNAAFHLRNFSIWFLKKLGIIREDNLINMVRHFMGQHESVKMWENPEEEKKE